MGPSAPTSRRGDRAVFGKRTRLYAGGLLLLLAYPCLVALKTLREELRSARPARVLPRTASDVFADAAVDDVVIQSEPGLKLAGWYLASRNGAAVLLVHGYGANREELAVEGKVLAEQGFGVLLIDLRAHGLSEGDTTTYGDKERTDVGAAIRWLHEQKQIALERIGVIGFSMGAAASSGAALRTPGLGALVLAGAMTSISEFCWDEAQSWAWIKAPVCLAVLHYYGIDVEAVAPREAVRRMANIPLLVVHGTHDGISPPRRARELFEAAHPPKQLLLLQGAEHGRYAATHAHEYTEALTAFFRRYLLGPPLTPRRAQ